MHTASGFAAASEQSAMNSSLDSAKFSPRRVNWSTTSSTGVLTMGLPVAMYSSALVGLMYSVASLMRERHQAHVERLHIRWAAAE